MKHPRISLALASAAALLASIQPAAAATIGDIIRADYTNPYLLNASSSRLAFPDDITVETWGNPEAQQLPGSALTQWNLVGTMPLREGSKLVKFGTDPQIYAVSPGGVLHWITRPSLASDLYGPGWSQRVAVLFYSYYPNYKIGSPISEARHPEGTLFKYADASAVYYLTGSGVARPFFSEAAFKANRFSFDGVIAVPRAYQYIKGNYIYGFEKNLNLIVSES